MASDQSIFGVRPLTGLLKPNLLAIKAALAIRMMMMVIVMNMIIVATTSKVVVLVWI